MWHHTFKKLRVSRDRLTKEVSKLMQQRLRYLSSLLVRLKTTDPTFPIVQLIACIVRPFISKTKFITQKASPR